MVALMSGEVKPPSGLPIGLAATYFGKIRAAWAFRWDFPD
jgi:hypothetical protein